MNRGNFVMVKRGKRYGWLEKGVLVCPPVLSSREKAEELLAWWEEQEQEYARQAA
jgi:hypothetical protein